MFYLHGRHSHALAGWPRGLYASRLEYELGIRPLFTQANAALHTLVSPLASQGDMQYEQEYIICNLTGAAGGRSVHFHCHGQHPLEQEHCPG